MVYGQQQMSDSVKKFQNNPEPDEVSCGGVFDADTGKKGPDAEKNEGGINDGKARGRCAAQELGDKTGGTEYIEKVKDVFLHGMRCLDNDQSTKRSACSSLQYY